MPGLRCSSFAPLLVAALLFVPGEPRAAEPAKEVILATTTSVRDAGLLDVLLPPFRERTGIDVKVIAVGSGAALQMARDGNADLVLAHAPEGEEKLLADGFALDRRALAENFFVIAGPPDCANSPRGDAIPRASRDADEGSGGALRARTRPEAISERGMECAGFSGRSAHGEEALASRV